MRRVNEVQAGNRVIQRKSDTCKWAPHKVLTQGTDAAASSVASAASQAAHCTAPPSSDRLPPGGLALLLCSV